LPIKTRRGRGGEVARVSVSDCRMAGVHTPLAINAFYFCDPDGRSDSVQSRAAAAVDETTSRIADIGFTRVHATGVRHAVAAILGLPEAPTVGIRLSEFSAKFDPRRRRPRR
jgi:polygalacturonase